MDKFFKRKPISKQTVFAQETSSQNEIVQSKTIRLKVDLENLLIYLGLQTKILEYHPNYCDKVKMAYPQKGPY